MLSSVSTVDSWTYKCIQRRCNIQQLTQYQLSVASRSQLQGLLPAPERFEPHPQEDVFLQTQSKRLTVTVRRLDPRIAQDHTENVHRKTRHLRQIQTAIMEWLIVGYEEDKKAKAGGHHYRCRCCLGWRFVAGSRELPMGMHLV